MDKQVFFSIIIPTYNRGHIILNTIESLLNQSYDNYEIIIVDDGSTDNTKSVIEGIENSQIKYFKKENGERGAARNFGAQQSKGDFLNFFDSDDIAMQNHLIKAAQLIRENNNIELFTLGYNVISNVGLIQKTYNNYPANINEGLFENGNMLSCDAVFIRRDIAVAYPFIEDRELAGSEDAVLWMKLAARFKWHFSNEVTSSIVNHESRSVLEIDKEKLLTRLNLFVNYVSNDELVKLKFGSKLKNIKLESYTYAALHLVLAGYKKEALKYYFKSLRLKPTVLFKKRSAATIKRILFG